MGAFTYDVSKILENFTLPLSALSDPPPPFDDVSICQTPPPPISKNPLHNSLIQTLNVYLIQLKTERCQVNVMCNHTI